MSHTVADMHVLNVSEVSKKKVRSRTQWPCKKCLVSTLEVFTVGF